MLRNKVVGQNDAMAAVIAHSRASTCSNHSSVSTSSSSDPTVSSLGVQMRRLSQTAVGNSLMTQSAYASEVSSPHPRPSGNFFMSQSTALADAYSALSSGTGTASPDSLISARSSTCSSSLGLSEVKCELKDNRHLPRGMVDLAIRELIDTETSYVRDLEDVIIGYIVPLRIERKLSAEDLEVIFGNIEEIYYLNKRLLMRMQKADDRSSGFPSLAVIARCFSDQSNCEKLMNTYHRYCSSSLASSARLQAIQRNSFHANVFRDLQVQLHHPLPLLSYLMKPVQRILRYPLLWKNIADLALKHSHQEHSFAVEATLSMANIAHKIDSCVKSSGVQASCSDTSVLGANNQKSNTIRSLHGMTTSAILPTLSTAGRHNILNQTASQSQAPSSSQLSVTTATSAASGQPFVRAIVMRGHLIMRGAKHPRHVVLFDSSLVIYKVHRMWRKSQEQEQLIHQVTIPAENLKLVETSQYKASTSTATFSVEAVNEPRSFHTFQAENVEAREKWCQAIRNIIMKAADLNSKLVALGHTCALPPHKRHQAGLSQQMSTSAIVFNQNGNHQNLQHCRSASPYVGLESTHVVETTNSRATTCIGNGTDIAVDDNSSSSHSRFVSVGSSIVAHETEQNLNRNSNVDSRQLRKLALPDEMVTPGSPWLEPHAAINRTDSEKWRERSRWKAKILNCDQRSVRGQSENRLGREVYADPTQIAPKLRVFVPWKHSINRRTFVRRPSFICEAQLLRAAQQQQQKLDNANLKTPKSPSPLLTPTLPSDAQQRRYSRSNGLKRFFDNFTKRFRSSDRNELANKSFVYAPSSATEATDFQHPPLSIQKSSSSQFSLTTSLRATSNLNQSDGCLDSPSSRHSTAELQQIGCTTIDRAEVLSQARAKNEMARQASSSTALFTPAQQRQFKKKAEGSSRTVRIPNLPVAGKNVRDVFV